MELYIIYYIAHGTSLEGLMLKLKLQYFGHLMWRTDSSERTLLLGKTEDSRQGRRYELVGWHHPLDGHEFMQAPGVGGGQGSLACLKSTGSQRVGNNWVTELNWTGTLFTVMCQSGWEKDLQKNGARISMAESSRCSETTTTLLIGYTPIQNKKFKVWKNCKKRKDHIRKLWFSHMLYCTLASDVAEEKSDANLILILFSEICFFSLIALRIFFHFWCCKISLLHDSVQVFFSLFILFSNHFQICKSQIKFK